MRNRYQLYFSILLAASLLVVPLQAQVYHVGAKLKVNNAIYGRNGQGANVTNRVRSIVQSNSLDFKVNNGNLGGDPNVGADKVLRISYTYQGQTRTASFKEGDRCRLP